MLFRLALAAATITVDDYAWRLRFRCLITPLPRYDADVDMPRHAA